MIFEVLLPGKENAIPGKDLAQILGIPLRELTAQIERERRAGKPICANQNGKAPGYYLADTKATMARYCEQLHRRAAELYKTRQECLKTIDTLPEEAQ
jgi:biotin operon repressor